MLLPLIGSICFIYGCDADLPGLVIANDLDERLKEKNNLKFLKERIWTALTLEDEYKFIVLSDTHIEDGNAFGLEKLSNITIADAAIKYVVITGDITQRGDETDIKTFIKIANSLGVPCYPVAGNHDVYLRDRNKKVGWNVWKNYIGSTSYRIDSGSTTLFILDTANSFFGKDQLDWLEREIKNTKKNVFVFSHSTLFIEGPADMQQMTDTKERARILSILRGRCDVMFMGHLHKHLVNEAGNVKYISLASFIEEKMYYLVTVTPKGVTYERKKL